jgi:hypothetical protein
MSLEAKRRLDEAKLRWLKAIKSADAGDIGSLINALLDLDLDVTVGARKLMADLLERHLGKGPKGKRKPRRVPIYEPSLREQYIAMVVDSVRRLRSRGMEEDDAIDLVVRLADNKIHPTTLRNAYHGRRPSAKKAPTR